MRTEFAKAVEFVRDTFFPAWDHGRCWKVVQAHDLDGAQGQCDRATRTISILEGISGDRQKLLLIHEIAHAVVGPHHGKRWFKRMEKATLQAEQLGDGPLAALLRKEVEGYHDAYVLTAAGIYTAIGDTVWENANATFFQTIDFVRRDFGMSRLDFLKRFARAEKVYERARRDALEEAAAKRQFLRDKSFSDDQKR
jgi:hypothetical protein